MSKRSGLAIGGALLIAALFGALMLDRYSTGLPALLFCPISAAFIASALSRSSRLASAIAAVGVSILNLVLFTSLLAIIHDRRFGRMDPEGFAAFLFLMAIAGVTIAPVLAAILWKRGRA